MSLKIAENLLFLRKQQGITQEALAEVLGVTSQSISKWELGINCPDISLLPEIASFYKISIDELLGYKPISSINSIYMDIRAFIESEENKIDNVYKIARLAVGCSNKFERSQAERLLDGKRDYSLSYGQNESGVTISSDQSIFICSFNDLRDYDVSTIRKVYNYLNKLNDVNTLKVLFALFSLQVNNKESNSFSINEISDKCKLSDSIIYKALDNLDVSLDKEELEKNGEEKYVLEHMDQVPLLITMLISVLDKYNGQIKD